MQASQATFKSIKAIVPLLDRVLVQRFKPDTVRGGSCSTRTRRVLTPFCVLILELENRCGHLPPSIVDGQPVAGGDSDRCGTWCAGQGRKNRSHHGQGGRQGSSARMGWKLDQAWRRGERSRSFEIQTLTIFFTQRNTSSSGTLKSWPRSRSRGTCTLASSLPNTYKESCTTAHHAT